MKLTKILICLLIFWTGTLSASPYFSFKKYQVEDGLSHNTVWCALQDSYGSVLPSACMMFITTVIPSMQRI